VTGARGYAGDARRALGLAAALFLAEAAFAGQIAWQSEGPLENDAFLPTSKSAEEALTRGDRSLEQSRKAEASENDGEALRHETAAFEAWREALERSARGESVWFAAEAAEERRLTLGVERALERRLLALPPGGRARWSGRFEDLARSAVESAGVDAERLADAARRHPGTFAAARAWTKLGDLAFEQGWSERARAAWRHATETVAWIGEDAQALSRGLESRASRLLGATSGDSSRPESALDSATEIRATGAVNLPDPAARLAPFRPPGPNTGVRPGLALLSETRLAVQTASSVHLVRIDEWDRPRVEIVFRPSDLLPKVYLDLDARIGRRPPGWPLLPAARDGDLALVVGRGGDATNAREGEPNALFLIRPDGGNATEGELGLRFPSLRWAIVGNERFAEGEEGRPIPELAELAGIVFQPGPVLTEELVVVQARRGSGDFESWLFAFERRAGDLRFKRLVASGAEVQPDLGRIGTARFPSLFAGPLAERGGFAFVSTHLGAGAWLDLSDGTFLWTLKVARRSPEETGWDGGAPRFSTRDGEEVLFWAPSDSEHLYAMRPSPVEGAGSCPVLVFPPQPREDATTFVGGDTDALVLQRRAGTQELVSERRVPSGRVDSLALAPSESFQGRGWVGRSRVLVSSQERLYLFDRSRDLYLVDDEPLPAPGDPSLTSGGDVFVRGTRILVLSRDALFAFRAR